MNKIYGISLALASLAFAASASAQTFDLSWHNSFTGYTNIVLDTTSAGEPAGEYLITGATGSMANLGAVTGVQNSDGADNILFTDQGKLYADYGGISFTIPGDYLNVFSSNGVLNEQNGAQTDNGNLSTPLCHVCLQAVPEPSTYAVFGFGAVGLLLRRRKK